MPAMFASSPVIADAARYQAARIAMIESQLRPNQVRDPALIAALMQVPREAFLPADLAGIAYLDESVAIAPGRCLIQPMVLAKLLQAARIVPGERVLDIAPGTGYSTAVIAAMGADVVAVEPDAGLHRAAEVNFQAMNVRPRAVLAGAPVEGCVTHAPYDVILINGAVDFVPDHLLAQMADGGRLLCVVRSYGPRHASHTGQARLYSAGVSAYTPLFDAQVPLAPDFAQPAAFDF